MERKKRGFTLVELLAVIVILAVILVIAVPRIMSVIKDAKLGSIESTAKLIASTAESSYESKKALGLDVGDLKCTDVASLSNDYGTCKITFDDSGVATVVINGKKGGKFDNLACQGTKDNMTCTEGEISTSRKCTTTDTLVNNLKFVDGQYTYTYNGSTGWSVVLTDKTSTDPVTTELCGTINDKPIVSMMNMFLNSKATSIDVSSFDTSSVTNMTQMFRDSAATEIKGLKNFDTSKVTDMNWMFYNSKATSLDLSSFDTSNVTDMWGMFFGSAATSIDLSSFDTSNVTNMDSMFYNSAATEIKGLENFDTSKVRNMASMFEGSKATSLDLSNFDTSNVTIMHHMFCDILVTTLDLSSFDTSKVTDMSGMFIRSQVANLDLSSFDTSKVTGMNSMFWGSKATSLDLSSFDTSNVTDMGYMFHNTKATTGYARTQEDADRFNASTTYRPSGLTFVVKSQ